MPRGHALTPAMWEWVVTEYQRDDLPPEEIARLANLTLDSLRVLMCRRRVKRPKRPTTHMMPDMHPTEPETWLPVTGFDGKYEVSDLGRVRSLRDTRGIRDNLLAEPRIMRQARTTGGCPSVGLCRRGHRGNYKVALLVLEAFVGPKPADKDLCAHWDGDPANNRPANLRWATWQENADDRVRHGRSKGVGAGRPRKTTVAV